MKLRLMFSFVAAALLVTGSAAWAGGPTQPAPPPQVAGNLDLAEAFGSRQDIVDLSLSPDGKSVAYVASLQGMGAGLYTLDLAEGSKPRIAFTVSGKPERLGSCHWVSDDRLVCVVYGVVEGPTELLPFTRVVAVDRSGGNFQLLSTRQNEYSQGLQLGGGEVLDWLPDEHDTVLMSRLYVPDEHLGSRVGSWHEGLAVDHLDTRTLQVKQVELPARDAMKYISDGRGTIRVIGRTKHDDTGMDSGVYSYSYRRQDSREWLKLGDYNSVSKTGFEPYAVDHDLNVVYGLKKNDGRLALYSVSLDGALTEKLVFARPDVDVAGLVRIGRRNRVVGVSYATDSVSNFYFDADIERLMHSLARALPDQSLSVVDSSVDENTLLVFGGSDTDPGVYYVFDRAAKKLRTFLVVRSKLEGVKLAKVASVTYPAADGVMIPGYLTLPPGVDSAKGLPAIVLPHGGPSARDYWGFDWLSQYYAARGFAVLQPNFRGSTGFGDAWLQQNGFRSWRTAIGDVNDAGRWLIAQGADADKLCIVGWSYGGYAALQSAVTEPGLFKAVVAIAPVTDLNMLKEEHRNWSDFNVVSNMVGEGQHLREASPARNADKVKVPVLMFHGTLDRNVRIRESRSMAARLTAAGVRNELVVFNDLDHYLDDSTARTELLRKSDEFLRVTIGDGRRDR